MIILTTATTGGGDEDKVILPVLDNFDSFFINTFKSFDYGGDVSECIIYIHSVFSDELDNFKWGMPRNKMERRKNFYGEKKWIKSIVLVLLFNPDVVAKMTFEQFRTYLCNTLLGRLQNPEMKILKAFDYESFKEDMTKIIKKYREEINIS